MDDSENVIDVRKMIMQEIRHCKTAKILAIFSILLLFVPSIVFCGQPEWVCPKCGRAGNTDKFCGTCAYPSPAPMREIMPEPTVAPTPEPTSKPTPNSDLYKTVGSIVSFGHYEQDNDAGNGKEPIEWIVLDVWDGKSLILSKYGLDAKPYNAKDKYMTWDQCTLREWLNSDFLNNAFSDDEQSAILVTTVDNSADQGYSDWVVQGSNDTEDKVFLLSYAEVKRYLNVTYGQKNTMTARVAPTAYAKAQGAYTSGGDRTSDGNEAGWWWLRSPGPDRFRAADVYTDDSLRYYYVSVSSGCVRPALWINPELIFCN